MAPRWWLRPMDGFSVGAGPSMLTSCWDGGPATRPPVAASSVATRGLSSAARPAGDVQHFADEVEPGAVTGFHGARTDGGGIHATQGHLGGTVAFGGRRLDDPTIELAGDVQQLAVTELGQGFVRRLRPPELLQLGD